MIPLLTLGIPSSPTIAVLMGAFIINGLTPGPFLFQERPDLVWAVIASFFLGNILLLVLNLPFVGLWARILHLPYPYVCAGTLLFCVIGAYSLQQNVFDIGVMIVCGIIGYGMRKIDMPIAPLVLGLILGPFLEKSLRTSLEMSAGDFSIFFTRPLCLTLLVLAAIVLVASALRLPPRELREASST
jgi:putative tricarboxylic transport membrane protein